MVGWFKGKHRFLQPLRKALEISSAYHSSLLIVASKFGQLLELVLRSDYITYADTLDCLVSFFSNPYTVAHVQYDLTTSWWRLCTIRSDGLFLLYFVRYQSRSHSYYDT